MNAEPLPSLLDTLEPLAGLHQLLLEENQWLRKNESGLPHSLLDRKQALLPHLDTAVARLRQLNQTGGFIPPADRTAVAQARQRLMQIFFLDRENEQFLLKRSVSPLPLQPAQAINQVLLHKTYAHGEPRSEHRPNRILSPSR